MANIINLTIVECKYSKDGYDIINNFGLLKYNSVIIVIEGESSSLPIGAGSPYYSQRERLVRGQFEVISFNESIEDTKIPSIMKIRQIGKYNKKR